MAKYGPTPRPLSDRFWEKVEKSDPDACWLWQGGTNGAGYGMAFDGKAKVLAHRISWELRHKRKVPKGKIVRHVVCDNPLCVNPRHLCVGTQRDNMKDRAAKGRDNHVDNFSKLRPDDVRDIVARYISGETQEKVAAVYDISGATVSQIIRGKIWTHVTSSLDLPERGRRNPRERKLTDAQTIEVRSRYDAGDTQQQLADHYGVSKALVQQIVTGKAWKHVQ